MECCTNTYNLGCFNHCNEIIFEDAPATELLTLVFFGANHIIKKAFNAIITEPIIINLNGLNENYTYNLQIFDNTNTIINFTIDGQVYDCFKIKTKIYNEI